MSEKLTYRFPIGTQYTTRGKYPRQCTVVDVWRTYSNEGKLVKMRYVSTHQIAGQTLTDYDVSETSIALGNPRTGAVK